MDAEFRVKPKIWSSDMLDFCICFFIVAPVQLSMLFGIPALIVYFLTHSSDQTFLAIILIYFIFISFSVWNLTLSADGIRFHRLFGSPKFLPWNRVASIEKAPRWELIVRGWLWPLFPAREMTTSLSSIGHYRIKWADGYCYFPPSCPNDFEKYIKSKRL